MEDKYFFTDKNANKLFPQNEIIMQMPSFDGFPILLPCRPKDKVYRIWTVNGRKVVASFTVEKFSVEEDGAYCIVTSNRHMVRRWNINEFGKTIFLDKDSAEEELYRQGREK